MLNAVLTLISIHFLISAQNNSSCGYSRRMNRQIYAGDVLPAYLLSARCVPVSFPVVPVLFPESFGIKRFALSVLFQIILTFSPQIKALRNYNILLAFRKIPYYYICNQFFS